MDKKEALNLIANILHDESIKFSLINGDKVKEALSILAALVIEDDNGQDKNPD